MGERSPGSFLQCGGEHRRKGNDVGSTRDHLIQGRSQLTIGYSPVCAVPYASTIHSLSAAATSGRSWLSSCPCASNKSPFCTQTHTQIKFTYRCLGSNNWYLAIRIQRWVCIRENPKFFWHFIHLNLVVQTLAVSEIPRGITPPPEFLSQQVWGVT